MDKISKFINECKSKGIKSSLKKASEYLCIETNKIKPTLSLLLSDNYVIVNWYDDGDVKNNFGDELNPILVSKLSKKTVLSYSKLFNIKGEPVYSVIGSVLNNLDIKNLEVWGSGFISEDGKFITKPTKVHAVRGPLTRKLMLRQGIDCPEIYGDPALLLSKIYKTNKNFKYKIGLIPHYVDKNNKYIEDLKNKYNDEVLIINIQDSIKNVIDNINQCETIASSSLHGIIVADTYGIPSLWIELSSGVIGSGFKFRDYMLSVGKTQMEPLIINDYITLNDLLNSFTFDEIFIDYNKLLTSCPFLDFNEQKVLKIYD